MNCDCLQVNEETCCSHRRRNRFEYISAELMEVKSGNNNVFQQVNRCDWIHTGRRYCAREQHFCRVTLKAKPHSKLGCFVLFWFFVLVGFFWYYNYGHFPSPSHTFFHLNVQNYVWWIKLSVSHLCLSLNNHLLQECQFFGKWYNIAYHIFPNAPVQHFELSVGDLKSADKRSEEWT